MQSQDKKQGGGEEELTQGTFPVDFNFTLILSPFFASNCSFSSSSSSPPLSVIERRLFGVLVLVLQHQHVLSFSFKIEVNVDVDRALFPSPSPICPAGTRLSLSLGGWHNNIIVTALHRPSAFSRGRRISVECVNSFCATFGVVWVRCVLQYASPCDATRSHCSSCSTSTHLFDFSSAPCRSISLTFQQAMSIPSGVVQLITVVANSNLCHPWVLCLLSDRVLITQTDLVCKCRGMLSCT